MQTSSQGNSQKSTAPKTSQLEVVILAAGQGTRMQSNMPKVLHKLAGTSLVEHVINKAQQLEASRTHLIVGHGAAQVEAGCSHLNKNSAQALNFVTQTEQLGTGHAVAQALPFVAESSQVLILYGDVPLTKTTTLQQLLAHVSSHSLGLLTVNLPDPSGYGRIVRNNSGAVTAIVEHKDATPEQLEINEINTGILALTGEQLHRWLPQLSNNNAQGEYYLTDLIAMAANEGLSIKTVQPNQAYEVEGVNNRQQLAALERQHQQEIAANLMAQGVTLADPERLDVRGELSVEKDVSIDVGCIFSGKVSLATGVEIGPYCVIKNAHIGAGVKLAAFTHIEDAVLDGENQVGPYARLRPGTHLEAKAKIGNFVETKQTRLGAGAKVNHLSYIGDAQVGAETNIGAGTITCNYDGVNKHQTLIGAGVFVGSNTSLVAPINIGAGATLGAGSTLTKDVAENSLAVARPKQVQLANWQKPSPKQK